MQSDAPEREAAVAAFYRRCENDPLVLDKWFALQAGAWRWAADAGRRWRACGNCCSTGLHARQPEQGLCAARQFLPRQSGRVSHPAGHAFWAEQIVALDAINPQVARMARALERWRGLRRPTATRCGRR